MKYEILAKQKPDKALVFIEDKLPMNIRTSVEDFLFENPEAKIDEIRLHKDCRICYTYGFSTVFGDLLITQNDIEETVQALCSNSVYAHFATIKEGYISVGHGVRAGVCGKANTENGKISAVSDITSINIRFPKRIFGAGDYIFSLLTETKFKKSILLYSPPGIGKTTILRELICLLNELENPIRFSVIDTREEIIPYIENKGCSADAFLSYPKGKAIEIATRTMTPELIICDEISSNEDAKEIINSVMCGVTFVATTHASSLNELTSKKILLEMINQNVFDYALGVTREKNSTKYSFSLSELKK